MERPSNQVKETEEKLKQEYKDWQEEWNAIKKIKPNLHKSLTDSRAIVKGLHHLVENSPRKLMSSLQHRRSPSGAWKLGNNNDSAVAEILSERKAAIESGKLKGRRLFDATDDEVGSRGIQDEINFDGFVQEISEVYSYDTDIDDHNENNDVVESEGVHYSSSASPSSNGSSSSCSYICDVCMEKEIVSEEGKKTAVEMVEPIAEVKNTSVNGTVKGRLAIGLILLCAVIIISIRRSFTHRDGDGHKVILVPT